MWASSISAVLVVYTWLPSLLPIVSCQTLCDICDGRGGAIDDNRNLSFVPVLEKIVTYTGGSVRSTCGNVDEIVELLADPTVVENIGLDGPVSPEVSCKDFKLLGVYCGCEAAAPNPCTICAEGAEVTSPDEEVYDFFPSDLMYFEPTCTFIDVILSVYNPESWECHLYKNAAMESCSCPDPIAPEGCVVTHTSWIGDGFCDLDVYNTVECGWDGGDCCSDTCTDGLDHTCGESASYNCLDPFSTSIEVIAIESKEDTACDVENPEWIGDGWCDSNEGYNTESCGWDGGDCCEEKCVSGAYECGVNDYDCHDTWELLEEP